MSSRYDGERVGLGIQHFLVGKGLSAICGLSAIVLVVRLLSIEEFAGYSILVAFVEIITALAGLGLSHALLRYVPELYAKKYSVALRQFVLGAALLRTGVLLVIVLVAWVLAPALVPGTGLDGVLAAFRVFLLVVLFRTTSHFISQVLESTLHQGLAQRAFLTTSLLRLIGMVYLTYQDEVTLLDVVWVEVGSDAAGMILMCVGLAKTVWDKTDKADAPSDDTTWVKRHFLQIVRFAKHGYTQHLVGLPFGSNTNRLVGGFLFKDVVMASLGFAYSLYEYIKRYLPAQLLVGVIRPVVVARFSETGDFGAAASTCQRVLVINMLLLGVLATALGVSGNELLSWISGGKYGTEALLLLLTLCVVVALESQRLLLELMVQTVERYSLLIPSNILLSLSVLPGVLLSFQIGAVALPLANAGALVVSNYWVGRSLAAEGFRFSHRWRVIAWIALAAGLASASGTFATKHQAGWPTAMAIAVLLYLFIVGRLVYRSLRGFRDDLLGTKQQRREANTAPHKMHIPRSDRNSVPAGLDVRILSMQRVVNYGSFLQAYALKRTVEAYGHTVSFCDFRPGMPRHLGQKVIEHKIWEKLLRLRRLLISPGSIMRKRMFRNRLRGMYQRELSQWLGVGVDRSYSTACDVLIVGSDEVFNYTQNHAFGYVPAFFGHGLCADKIISYAASAGYANADDVERDDMVAEVTTGLAKFAAVSVRDSNTFDLVRRYAPEPTMVLDPTLIFDFESVMPTLPSRPPFLLVYAYEGRLDGEPDVSLIVKFAKERSLLIISVGFYHEWCDENVVLTPFEVLSLFRQASYVLTDTFHGTIFSIKNHRLFASLIRDEHRFGSNANKLGDLLNQLGLEHRICRDIASLGEVIGEPIDYAKVDQALAVKRRASIGFIESAFQ